MRMEDGYTPKRAAQAMRTDARSFRAIAANAKAQPNVYGLRAQDYADGIAARYEILAAFCDHEASKMESAALGLHPIPMQPPPDNSWATTERHA